MKKNKLMRFASLLLIATLLTTSVISGTFAKYVTMDSAEDTARVAKFGVVATVSGNLFGDSYSASPANSIQAASNNNAITVTASNTASAAMGNKLVAPGTKNTTGMSFGIKGTPEVSTTITFGKAENADGTIRTLTNADVHLKAGTYGVMVPFSGTVTTDNVANYWVADGADFKKATATDTTGFYELVDIVTIAADYYPITWYYKLGDDAAVDGRGATALSAANTAIATHFNAANTPNTKLDKTAQLTWEWKFENDGLNGLVANEDTILGDLIAKAAASNLSTVAATGNTAYAETANFTMVKLASASASSAITIQFAEVGTDNKVVVAYTGTDAPAAATGRNMQEANVAVLTVAYDASLTVTQVD